VWVLSWRTESRELSKDQGKGRATRKLVTASPLFLTFLVRHALFYPHPTPHHCSLSLIHIISHPCYSSQPNPVTLTSLQQTDKHIENHVQQILDITRHCNTPVLYGWHGTAWSQKSLELLKIHKCISTCSSFNRIPNPMCTRLLTTWANAARESRAWMARQVHGGCGLDPATFFLCCKLNRPADPCV